MKSYTDIEQSKKLAKILPVESADMCWTNHCYGTIRSSLTVSSKTIEEYKNLLTRFADLTDIDVFCPCWSLAALLDVLPKGTNISIPDPLNKVRYSCWNDYDITYADNPVDACVEMIIKLQEENLII